MRKKKLTPLEERFELFIFFLNDIDNFIDKRDIIEKFPDQIKLLDEIVRGTNIHALIRKNNIREFERIEQERRDKIDRKRKGIREVIIIKELTEEDIEREILELHQKSVETKLSLNPSYFGQKSFSLLNYNYSGDNEIKELSLIIKDRIKDLLIECFENAKDPNKETKKLLCKSKNFIFHNKNYKTLEDKIPEKILIYKNEMYNKNLINNKVKQNLNVFKLLLDMEKNSKLIHQFIYDNEIDNKESENIGINTINTYQTLSSVSDKIECKISHNYNPSRNSNNRYNSYIFSQKSKEENKSTSGAICMSNKKLRPKTSSSRVETSASYFKTYSNNFTQNNTFKKNRNVSTPSINDLLLNKKKSENNKFLPEYLKDLLDVNEIQYLTNHRLNFDKKIDYRLFNYDYSKLLKIRTNKKGRKINIKYPIFAISQNMINLRNILGFPPIENKSKKKGFNIYSERDKKTKLKSTKH